MENNKIQTRSNHSATGIIVYFNAEKTSSQICRPKMEGDSKSKFDGNWKRLADSIAGNNGYHSFDII